jgi:saccharopine dehydrogenase-like NADP-dependent oxidoreductase
MRVLVLGGAGGMGRVAVMKAAAYAPVAHVTAADLDLARAQAVAAEVGSNVSGVSLDVNDRAAMRTAIQAHDLVLNAVGPFYVLGLPVLEQVIDAGRNYADICDDWEPTLDMLALSPRAKERGVVALVGLGASPGVTNMLALKAARALDEVDELITGWSIEGTSEDLPAVQSARPRKSGASAAVVHWVQQLTGTIRVLKDGGYQQEKPLQAREIYYPGYGALKVWSVGHPEAVTLPRATPGLLACSNVMVGEEGAFRGLALLAGLVDTGVLTVHQAADEVAKDLAKKPRKSPSENRREKPGLFAWASGRLGGRPAVAVASVRSMPPGGMAGATSVPLSLALPLFERGFEGCAGVYAPEEVIDPDQFFDLLAPHCVGEFERGADLVSLQTALTDG